MRDFVSVDDCVDVIMWLFDTPEVSGLFNLGTGAARSFADLARAVYATIGLEPHIEFIDTPKEIRDKYQYFTQANMAKLRAAGCNHKFQSLDYGVDNYVRNFLDQTDPYR